MVARGLAGETSAAPRALAPWPGRRVRDRRPRAGTEPPDARMSGKNGKHSPSRPQYPDRPVRSQLLRRPPRWSPPSSSSFTTPRPHLRRRRVAGRRDGSAPRCSRAQAIPPTHLHRGCRRGATPSPGAPDRLVLEDPEAALAGLRVCVAEASVANTRKAVAARLELDPPRRGAGLGALLVDLAGEGRALLAGLERELDPACLDLLLRLLAEAGVGRDEVVDAADRAATSGWDDAFRARFARRATGSPRPAGPPRSPQPGP